MFANGTDIEERFWSKVRKGAGCWEWVAGKNKDGYGQFHLGGKQHGAARASYLIRGIDLPSDVFVCHTCDNPSCVNPEHLFLGSHSDNMQDMMSKGRKHSQAGERHSGVKLTEEDVRWIRQLGCTQEKAANAFGVSRSTISLIRSGKLWAHVPSTSKGVKKRAKPST